MDATERFLENWSKLSAELEGEPAWLVEQRASGRARFAALGFPTTRDEDWKYTNLAALTRTAFELPEAPGSLARSSSPRLPSSRLLGAIDRWRLPGMALAVFVDGCFAAEFADLQGLPDGVRVESMRAALQRDPAWVAEHLGNCVGWPTHPPRFGGSPTPPPHSFIAADRQAFTALNTGLWRDGIAIHVPAGIAVERPLQVLHLSTSGERAAESQLRHLVVAERGAELTWIEHYAALEVAAAVGGSEQPSFTNVVCEVVVGENARVDRYKIEAEHPAAYHVARLEVRQARNSRLRSHVFSLGGQLVRNDICCRLGAEGADCMLNGLFLADGERLVDHHTTIDHVMPRCTSSELYKGVLGGKSKGVFNGKVYVREGAVGTCAQQSNKNLLLSRSATINTKPQLEIWADDVKCTHGATVGQLDQEAMFYLRTRGIGPDEARSMLIRAFAAELLDGVLLLPLRMQLEAALEERLT